MSNGSSVAAAPAAHAWVADRAQRARRMLVHRRVKITQALAAALIVLAAVQGRRPHDVLALGDPQTLLGLGLIFAGLALRSWAAGTLCKDSIISRTGPYSLIRHPLYVGSFLMMFGFCALVGAWENYLVVAGPVAIMYLCRVLDEEAWLARRHPEQWPQYSDQTPRFVPRRKRPVGGGDWSFCQWIQGQEYRAVVGVALGLGALRLWRIL